MRCFVCPRQRTCNVLGVAFRSIILRPEGTLNPERYPLGYIPLDGSEPIDAVYAAVQHGHFVAPIRRIEAIHNVSIGVRKLCRSEYPVTSVSDIVGLQLREAELNAKLLIRRDFWTLDDFNDPELNQSFGVQNFFFDNYKWSQVLWKRFQMYVEEYFPVADHTHLTYTEYTQLIIGFAAFEQGVAAPKALPKSVRLHPPFGAIIPKNFALEPILLLKNWITNFRASLSLNRALVVNAGAGVIPFAALSCGVSMVRGLDSRPRFVAACRQDAARNPKVSNVSFQVAEFLPEETEISVTGAHQPTNYDLVVYYPDEDLISMYVNGENDCFAPSASGLAGKLETFFEKVAPYMAENGVVAICSTNLHSLIFPKQAHPIEYEVKHNRRFVILDYYDAPARKGGNVKLKFLDPVIECNQGLKQQLRSELWILHKVESIEHFGFIHGIPGAKPPRLNKWRVKKMGLDRQRQLKDHVSLMGGDWGDYKGRLLSMLQEQSDTEEDDVAEAVRMALDPMYPVTLAKRAEKAVAANIRLKEEFHRSVSEEFTDISPREEFARKYYSQN